MRFSFLSTFLFVLFTACSTPGSIGGDGPGYKQLLELAEIAEGKQHYQEAAQYYRQAYDLKPGKPAPVAKAAELFNRIRDYDNAAAAYGEIPSDDLNYPLLGLRYGRALKQAGQYLEAERVFTLFQAGYNGSNRAIVSELIDNELRGIRLGQTSGLSDYVVKPLGPSVNSRGNETGATILGADKVLFTSSQGGRHRLLITQQSGPDWLRAAAPGGFPVITGGRFGTGSFSSDGNNYFFTICSDVQGQEVNRCELYRTGKKLSGAWKQPVRLSDNVNLPGANNAYPAAVLAEGGVQILYFASDREGGRGGLDLYYAVQTDPNNDGLFSDPVSLGQPVNTAGDELSPAYDPITGVLYFASNGHPGLGGLDAFQAKDLNGAFAEVQNMGRPINSPADDFCITVPGSTGFAVFSSNRVWQNSKTTTLDDDLYQVALGANSPVLQARLYEAGSGNSIKQVEVTLLEKLPDGREQEVARRSFGASGYLLPLEAGKSYRVMLNAPGYQSSEYRVQTDASGSSIYGRPVYLQLKEARPQVPGAGTNPSGEPVSTDVAQAETIYRLQISATKQFDPNEARYRKVKAMGELRSEAIPGRELKRITIGNYGKLTAARTQLTKVRKAGFPDAFIVQYDSGKRVGRVR